MAARALRLALLFAFLTACSGASAPPTVLLASTDPAPPPVARAGAPEPPDPSPGDDAEPSGAVPAGSPESVDVGATGSLHLPAGSGPVKPGAAGGLSGLAGLGGPGPAATARGPIVSVTVGTLTVSSGALARVEPVIARMGAEFRHCLQKALQDQPTSVTEGAAVEVTAQINATGGVVNASPSRARGMSARTVACIVSRVAGAQFSYTGGPGGAVVIPITVHVKR